MNLTRLQTFVEVVRCGTFAAAADALSFTPSAVSQQMTKLEAESGQSLLVREAGGVRLTEAGRLLHEHAIGIVEAVRHAQAQLEALEAEQVGRLRLGGCPVAAGAVLPRALRLLRRRLPTADLLLEEAAAQDTRQAVIDGRLEVGVWVSLAGGEEDPRLVETVLRREPLCAAIPAWVPRGLGSSLWRDNTGVSRGPRSARRSDPSLRKRGPDSGPRQRCRCPRHELLGHARLPVSGQRPVGDPE